MTNAKFVPIFAAAALFAVPMHASAQEQDVIEVRATAALAAWQKEAGASLDRSLARAPSLRGGRANEAIVQVAFEIGANGKAHNMRLLDGEGNAAARQAALYAVRSLDTLDQVPSMGANRTFLANVILHDSPASGRQLAQRLVKSERLRLSGNDAARDYVAFGSVTLSAGAR